MRSAFEISAGEIMNENPVTATSEESISQIKNRMEEHEIRAIPVVEEENKDFVGVIGYRELVRFVQFNPEITAPEKMMHQPPEFEPGDNLVELSDLRINSGRKMLVATEGKKLKGVIGDQEFLNALVDVKELKDVSTGRLATRDLIEVSEDDVLDRARHLMLDKNISRLPVVDSSDRLTGLMDSVDVLRMIIRQDRQNSGGTSGNRDGRNDVNIAGGKEKDKMSEITVDQLMQENPSTSKDQMSGHEAVKKMVEENEDDIIFVENGYPESIITLKDLIEYLAGLAQQQTIMVQITGADLPEEKAVLHKKIRNQLQGSLGRKLKKPEELKLVIKKKEKDGKKHRWELDLNLSSEYGVTAINEEGWDLLDTLDEALNELNTVIRKEHDKRTEHH